MSAFLVTYLPCDVVIYEPQLVLLSGLYWEVDGDILHPPFNVTLRLEYLFTTVEKTKSQFGVEQTNRLFKVVIIDMKHCRMIESHIFNNRFDAIVSAAWWLDNYGFTFIFPGLEYPVIHSLVIAR